MGAKRALIVDDSKSARLFLARILEKYEIDVDNAENAEAAIEYLASHRPDVIFMDHLMPGMDGFQAVQAIKNNPLTATIPIMMYTSQEGELYLGQARALGAVGVLPKQIKPTDVSKVLYQLHLLADRRSEFQGSFRPLNVATGAAPRAGRSKSPPMTPACCPRCSLSRHCGSSSRSCAGRSLPASIRRRNGSLRKCVLCCWKRFRLLLRLRLSRLSHRRRHVNQCNLRGSSPASRWVLRSPRPRCGGSSLHNCGSLAAKLTGCAGRLQRRPIRPSSAPASSMADATLSKKMGARTSESSAGEGLKPATAAPTNGNGGQSPPRALPTEAKPLVISVPYGADALGGPRLDLIRQLFDRLVKESHSGVVDIKSFAGRFCLMGNVNDGYSLAPDETPFSKCDVVGNPSDEALSAAQRIPLQFANIAGGVRNASHGALACAALHG